MISGCSSGNKLVINTAFESKIPEIKQIGVLITDVTVQEIAINGGRLLLREETAKAIATVRAAAVGPLRTLGLEPTSLINDPFMSVINPYNMLLPQTLYRFLLEKNKEPIIANFDVVAATQPDLDAFLLFRSCENEASNGKNALRVAAVLVGVIPVRGERTFADVAIVDRTGRLLYYNNTYDGGSLRDESDVNQTLTKLLKDYNGKQTVAN